jgi:hypothetical protein
MTDKKEPTLLNWPPSRGPKPDWMTTGPQISVPDVTLLTSERTPGSPTLADSEREDIEKALAGEGPRKIAPPAFAPDGDGAPVLVQQPSAYSGGTTRPRTRRRQTYHLVMNAHLASVASLDLRTAQRVITAFDEEEHRCVSVLPARTYHAKLIYPLTVDVMISIPPVTVTHATRPGRPERKPQPQVDVGYLAWVIAKTYAETIYKEWEHFGVWGHAIEDLWFETMDIDGEKLEVFLGS